MTVIMHFIVCVIVYVYASVSNPASRLQDPNKRLFWLFILIINAQLWSHCELQCSDYVLTRAGRDWHGCWWLSGRWHYHNAAARRSASAPCRRLRNSSRLHHHRSRRRLDLDRSRTGVQNHLSRLSSACTSPPIAFVTITNLSSHRPVYSSGFLMGGRWCQPSLGEGVTSSR